MKEEVNLRIEYDLLLNKKIILLLVFHICFVCLRWLWFRFIVCFDNFTVAFVVWFTSDIILLKLSAPARFWNDLQ